MRDWQAIDYKGKSVCISGVKLRAEGDKNLN